VNRDGYTTTLKEGKYRCGKLLKAKEDKEKKGNIACTDSSNPHV